MPPSGNVDFWGRDRPGNRFSACRFGNRPAGSWCRDLPNRPWNPDARIPGTREAWRHSPRIPGSEQSWMDNTDNPDQWRSMFKGGPPAKWRAPQRTVEKLVLDEALTSVDGKEQMIMLEPKLVTEPCDDDLSTDSDDYDEDGNVLLPLPDRDLMNTPPDEIAGWARKPSTVDAVTRDWRTTCQLAKMRQVEKDFDKMTAKDRKRKRMIAEHHQKIAESESMKWEWNKTLQHPLGAITRGLYSWEDLPAEVKDALPTGPQTTDHPAGRLWDAARAATRVHMAEHHYSGASASKDSCRLHRHLSQAFVLDFMRNNRSPSPETDGSRIRIPRTAGSRSPEPQKSRSPEPLGHSPDSLWDILRRSEQHLGHSPEMQAEAADREYREWEQQEGLPHAPPRPPPTLYAPPLHRLYGHSTRTRQLDNSDPDQNLECTCTHSAFFIS